MQRFARHPVIHARSIIPHPLQIRQPATNGKNGIMQQPIRMTVRAIQQQGGRRAPVDMPVPAYSLEIAIDAAGGNDHCVSASLEGRGLLFMVATAAGNPSAFGQQGLHPVAGFHGQQRLAGRVPAAQVHQQTLDQVMPRSPEDMESGEGIASAKLTTFHPAGQGQEPQPQLLQPEVYLIPAGVHIGLRPAARPVILVMKFAKGEPVLPGLFRCDAKTTAALFEAIDDKQATKTFLGLATQVFDQIAIEQGDPLALGDEFEAGDDACQATTNDDDFILNLLHARAPDAGPLTPDRAHGRSLAVVRGDGAGILAGVVALFLALVFLALYGRCRRTGFVGCRGFFVAL